MPSAKIHEAIAKEINKEKNMDETLLRIGTVAPDSWRNVDPSSVFHNKYLTHFNNPKLDRKIKYDYDFFYQKYNSYLNNPFYFGYLLHLIVDYYWKTYIDPLYELEKDGIKGYRLIDNTFHDNSNYFEYYDNIRMQKYLSKIYDLQELPINLPNFKCQIEEIDLEGLFGENGTLNYINTRTVPHEDLEPTVIYEMNQILKNIEKTTSFIKEELLRLEKNKKYN